MFILGPMPMAMLVLGFIGPIGPPPMLLLGFMPPPMGGPPGPMEAILCGT